MSQVVPAVTQLTTIPTTPLTPPTAPLTPTTTPSAGQVDAFRTQLADAMARPEITSELERFITDAHRHLIGETTGSVTLSKRTVETLVTAVAPTLAPADLAKIPPVDVDVPTISALNTARTFLAERLLLLFVATVALIILGLLVSNDRAASLKTVGRWLIAISLGHVLVMWVLPVLIVPRLTDSPWAHLVAGAARALGGGVITGLVLMLGIGIACIFAEKLMPTPNRMSEQPGAPGADGVDRYL